MKCCLFYWNSSRQHSGLKMMRHITCIFVIGFWRLLPLLYVNSSTPALRSLFPRASGEGLGGDRRMGAWVGNRRNFVLWHSAHLLSILMLLLNPMNIFSVWPGQWPSLALEFISRGTPELFSIPLTICEKLFFFFETFILVEIVSSVFLGLEILVWFYVLEFDCMQNSAWGSQDNQQPIEFLTCCLKVYN